MHKLPYAEFMKIAEETSENVQKRAFKLELLDSYNLSFEKNLIETFQKNGYIDAAVLKKSLGDFYNYVSRLKKNGVPFVRVHVVTLPLSDYVRWEIESYKLSQAAGETIYFIERSLFDSLSKPDGIQICDFVIFDNIVFLTEYEKLGETEYGEIVGGYMIENKNLVSKYEELEKIILSNAIPMGLFLSAHLKFEK